MNHFTVTHLGDELMATYSDGTNIIIEKQKPTDDFILDCACLLDNIAVKLSKLDKKEGK
jgi:CobQ-like glutamine amidotransferase family enzyme